MIFKKISDHELSRIVKHYEFFCKIQLTVLKLLNELLILHNQFRTKGDTIINLKKL